MPVNINPSVQISTTRPIASQSSVTLLGKISVRTGDAAAINTRIVPMGIIYISCKRGVPSASIVPLLVP